MSKSHRTTRVRLQGVVTLELLLVLPIYLLLLLGIIQLSLIYEVDKRTAYASRFGAKFASEITRKLSSPIRLSNLATSGTLRTEIDGFLETAGLSGACGVVLEHNACVPNPLQTDVDPGCDCSPPAEPLPGGEPGGAAYARVTVCVPLEGNVADLLPSFGGFSVVGKTLRHATLFRIEEDNRPPAPVIRLPNQLIGGAVTPMLPVASPPQPGAAITLPASSPASLILSFDGLNTSDPEEPFADLTLSWSADTDGNGSLETTGTGPSFVVSFLTPPPGGSITHRVRLQAVDGCLATAATQLLLTIQREAP